MLKAFLWKRILNEGLDKKSLIEGWDIQQLESVIIRSVIIVDSLDRKQDERFDCLWYLPDMHLLIFDFCVR